MNSIKLILFALLVFITFSNAQDIKPVKTAQDVIDNYMETNGGADNLKDVKSIKTTGSMNIMNTDVKLTVYISKDAFYLSTESADFKLIQAYDAKKNTGWTAFGEGVKDMPDADLGRLKESIEASLWVYYYDKNKYGITYELLQDEKIDSVACYVVEFKKGAEELQTVYYDKKNYNRVKSISPGNISTYSDFRKTGDFDIYMPYKITTSEHELKLTRYEFNKDFDKKLLEKPKEN